ncbi:MAG: hypothetical protein KDB14_12425, partial [Planctomycetales bacterium]|nr:hypothetical protein [Planctomycetales bacterium]
AAMPEPESSAELLRIAGRRLVTADGFGCTSCHAVGKVKPSKAPINAAGPDLAMLEQRIRREWFDRWVRNPARIVPRMEMPSVQTPIRGMLHDRLDEQLGAVWHVLNLEGFVPPEPNPVRIVRRRNLAATEPQALRPAVVTDVLHLEPPGAAEEQLLVKPLLIGLANRHNLLYDLESGRLRGWWTGDTARQHTKGKTWLWRPGAPNLLDDKNDTEWSLQSGAQTGDPTGDQTGAQWQAPMLRGQFMTEFEQLDFVSGAADAPDKPRNSVEFRYRLDFPDGTSSTEAPNVVTLAVTERITPLGAGPLGVGDGVGILRSIQLKASRQVTLRLAPPAPLSEAGRCLTADGDRIDIVARHGKSAWTDKIMTLRTDAEGRAAVEMTFTSRLPADRFLTPSPQRDPPEPVELAVAPGFRATRLPLDMEMMPTAIAWRGDGSMLVTSLKGRVWQLRDSNGDGLEESAGVFADDVAAPFGVAEHGKGQVDVVGKYALLRLTDLDGDGEADRWQRLASGWGHTADYHDWAIGLPRDEQGRYYISTACQQDSRSEAAAKWRGVVMRLTPQPDGHYQIEELSAGHRFPIGIARNRAGDLVVTDNQGNYNPFNELNHVQTGKRYGFINKLDRKPGFNPPLTEPAINIPHPWTRSVNGICFLESPESGPSSFGPYEGQLVGCEYDTRRLIRMSLESVNGELQGAAYPLTRTPADAEPLLGPLCAAVSPRGDLYVGCIRDSGWGGSNNIGTLVQLRLDPQQLPAGIAEVRVAADGFTLRLHGAVDWQRAARAENYSISSYRRISTPAYGGDDVDRRDEAIEQVTVSPQQQLVHLRLKPLRKGHVYEFQVQTLAEGTRDFFPAEAHYTVNAVPRGK